MWMAAVWVGALLGGFAVWAWAPRRRRLSPLPTAWTLAARRVLNADERRVYNQLRLAFPKYIVMPKLPLVRLCQPDTPDQVKFWYELIGAAHVTFAVCNPNGHVLLVIDLDSTRNHSRRSARIKESVLAACGVRRLHCAADDLPSIDALRLLLGDPSQNNRVSEPSSAALPVPVVVPVAMPIGEAISPPTISPGAQPEPAAPPAVAIAATPPGRTAVAPPASQPANWQDPSVFLDSFFTGDDRPDSGPTSESALALPDWPPVVDSRDAAESAVVGDDDADARWPRAPVRLVGRR